MAVPMENKLVKEENTSVIVTKIATIVKYLATRSKPRSLWNYEINFATGSWPNLQ